MGERKKYLTVKRIKLVRKRQREGRGEIDRIRRKTEERKRGKERREK